jgi:hypothetical protein
MDEQTKETVFYMKSMNEYAKQEIARYVRGVYDGAQAVKRQYGLDQEQPAQRQREPAAHAGKPA